MLSGSVGVACEVCVDVVSLSQAVSVKRIAAISRVRIVFFIFRSCLSQFSAIILPDSTITGVEEYTLPTVYLSFLRYGV